MYHVIAVPLDGNAFAESALPAAVKLASAAGARVHLVHVLDMLRRPAYAQDIAPHDWWGGGAMREADRYLTDVETRVIRAAGVEATRATLTGNSDEAILVEAEKVGADLIVMTTHGRAPVERLWLGSTADRIARTSPIPVLFVPGSEKGADSASPIFERLLVTLDGSHVSETVLPHATTFARVNAAEMRLVYVAEPARVPAALVPTGADATAPFVESLTRAEEAAETYLEGVAGSLDYDRVTTEVVLTGDSVAQQLLNVVEQRGMDAIALATHGRGGFRRFLLGSVADKLLRASRVPVLLCRPSGTEK